MKFLLLFIILICGCGENGISIHVLSRLSDNEINELIDGTEDILDYPITFDDNRYGAITIDIHKSSDDVKGRFLYGEIGCIKIAWSSIDSVYIAHETGHALGLEHSDDEQNLMYFDATNKFADNGCWGVKNVELTANQRKEMEKNIDLLNMCD